MEHNEQRPDVATGRDESRHAATSSDSDYSLSIDDALARYETADVPRTPRSIQRYCAKGDLDFHRAETPFGIKFLITPASIDRHIAYIKEVRQVATGRGMPRHVATETAAQNGEPEPRHEAPTTGDEPRQAATDVGLSRPVAADERVIQMLERENNFLRHQIEVKDQQITDQQERARETNLLINGLQRMLSPLLSAPDRSRGGDVRRINDFDGVHPDE